VGGAVIGAYRIPWVDDRWCSPRSVERVQPTPFQRDLSPTHAKRLSQKIDETQAFLDPLIVVRGEDGRLWTPNGRHRLAAGKMLGLRQITVLISPDETLAYRILALNTEKAHNLRDRSLEVVRMARSLAKRQGHAKETEFAAQFEAPELLTLGLVYEKHRASRGRVQCLPEEGRSIQRAHLARESARAGGIRGASPRDRHRGQEDHRRPDKARLQVTVPAQLRGCADQPGPLSQAEKGDTKPPCHRAGADADGASAKKFNVESVSNKDLAWVAVGAGD